MDAAGKVIIPFVHFVLQGIDANIEFKPDQEYQRVEVDQQHQDQYGTYGTIEFVIVRKIAHPIGKYSGKNYHQERS